MFLTIKLYTYIKTAYLTELFDIELFWHLSVYKKNMYLY